MSASFDSYKIFYYVGKYKNITHAATALFLSQSTVSRCMQSLESELGCKLIVRTQHGVSLTREGELLYNHIAKACEEIYTGEEQVLRLQRLSEGQLRIGVSGITFEQFVLPALKEFNRVFPSVQIEISSHRYNMLNSVIDELISRKIDIACVATAEAGLIDSGAIDAVTAASYTDIVIAGDKFSELSVGQHRLEELASYPFISLGGERSYSTHIHALCAERGVEINSLFKVDSMSMLIPILKSCPCLAIVPGIFRSDFTEDDPVFEVNLADEMPTIPIRILTAHDAPPSAAKDTFVRELNRYIKTKVYGIEK